MLTTRRATVEDAGLITRHRHRMFGDMQDAAETVLEEVGRNFDPWVRRMIVEDKYAGWITSDGEWAVGSAGLLILDWAPHFLDPQCDKRGYILNVFVEQEYRGRGIAKALTLECMAEAKRRRIGVVALHATDKGRPLYERLGFHASNELLFVAGAADESR